MIGLPVGDANVEQRRALVSPPVGDHHRYFGRRHASQDAEALAESTQRSARRAVDRYVTHDRVAEDPARDAIRRPDLEEAFVRIEDLDLVAAIEAAALDRAHGVGLRADADLVIADPGPFDVLRRRLRERPRRASVPPSEPRPGVGAVRRRPRPAWATRDRRSRRRPSPTPALRGSPRRRASGVRAQGTAAGRRTWSRATPSAGSSRRPASPPASNPEDGPPAEPPPTGPATTPGGVGEAVGLGVRSGDWAGLAVADPGVDPDVAVALGSLAFRRPGTGSSGRPGGLRRRLRARPRRCARRLRRALGVDRAVGFGVAFGVGVGFGVGLGVGGGGAVTTTSGGLTWVCSQTVPPVRAWKTYDHDPTGRVRFRW